MLPTTKSVLKTDFLTTRVVLCGSPKCGKSTFASKLGENVLFLATESGLDFLEVYKMDIKCWDDFDKAVKLLATSKHTYTTVVIDVMDNLIEMCETEICKRNKVELIKDIPFGGGWTASKRMLKAALEDINKLGLGLTIITHTKDKEVKQEVMSWTALGTSMPKSYEEMILGMCDLILLAYVNQKGERVIRTKPTKFIQCAGDRSGKLPEVMPLDAKLVIEALKAPKVASAQTAAVVAPPFVQPMAGLKPNAAAHAALAGTKPPATATQAVKQ